MFDASCKKGLYLIIMRRYIIYTLLGLFICTSFKLYSQKSTDGDAITGRWIDEKGLSVTKIFKNKDIFEGKIIWLKNPYDANGNVLRDSKNEDKNLRSRLINGMKILTDVSYKGDGKWDDGKLYIPKLGEAVDCSINLISSDTIEINAYYGITKIGKTIKWIRE